MKKIEAIIRSSKLKAVQEGLKEPVISCLTVVPENDLVYRKVILNATEVRNRR